MHMVMPVVDRGEVHLVDTTTGVSRHGALGRVEGLDTDTYPSGLIDGGRVAVKKFKRHRAAPAPDRGGHR